MIYKDEIWSLNYELRSLTDSFNFAQYSIHCLNSHRSKEEIEVDITKIISYIFN